MAMAAVALERPGIERPAISRFELGDLPRHGGWLIPRLVAALELPEQRLAGWLRSLIESNEHLFLVQEHSVALAEMQRANGLADKPIVRERFVLIEDIENAAQQKEAADFYDEFKRWAKNLSADIILVQELTNVPAEMIKEKLGRIYQRQQQFARV
jgi:hypothetical protein